MKTLTRIPITLIIIASLMFYSFSCFAENENKANEQHSSIDEFYLQVGDGIPDLEIVDYVNNSYTLADLVIDESVLLIYARSTCKDCQAYFKEYSSILSSEMDSKIHSYIIWDDNISMDTIQNNNFNIDKCFSTQHKYKLNNWVPTYFLVKNGAIVYKTINYEDLIRNYPELIVEENHHE